MPHNVSLQHCVLDLFAVPNFYYFVQLFVGECKIATVIGINVTYTSIPSVAEAPKRLNEGTCLKRLHHFKMYSSCREAVEDAHVAFHLASSNPNKDGAHKICSTSSEGRSKSHSVYRQGSHLLFAYTCLPKFAAVTQPKSFLHSSFSLQDPEVVI